MHRAHASMFTPSSSSMSGAGGSSSGGGGGGAEGTGSIAVLLSDALKHFNVKIAYGRLVPLRDFVGWGEDYPFDAPKTTEVFVTRLSANLNHFGSNYFLVIAAA
jgi:hypothetical protein